MTDNTATTGVWIVVAAFNEGSAIAATLADLTRLYPNVVVVDDCSSDNTSLEARRYCHHVLRHAINLGQGAALQTGIDYALLNGAQYIVTFDADGQHDPADIGTMLAALRQSNARVALGSRFLGKTIDMSSRRRLLLRLAIWFTKLSGGIKLTDVHNGLRVMTRSFCESFKFTQNRMAHASEILNFIASSKTTFIECPVTIRYTEYSIEKGQKGSNALRILMELFMGFISK